MSNHSFVQSIRALILALKSRNHLDDYSRLKEPRVFPLDQPSGLTPTEDIHIGRMCGYCQREVVPDVVSNLHKQAPYCAACTAESIDRR